MSEMNLTELAEKMADIDIAVLTTRGAGGGLAGRPMSNNGDVKYTGESYFFAEEHTHAVADIERDANVGLVYKGSPKLFMDSKFYVFVEGHASLIRDKSSFAAHWTPELDKWFDQGIDTPSIVMIKVQAVAIRYWDGMKHGIVKV